MPDEIRLWSVTADERLDELPSAKLDLEARLQEWLAHDIALLDPGLLVIGREVETSFGTFIDLLCMDAAGDLVVVELKRDKTPREVTAQALDYGSWVVDLSNEQVRAIAQQHLRDRDLDEAFRERFGVDVPETLNGDHRLLVVGSRIDDSSERIIRYLSDHHGVNINAATFQYFRDAGGRELLARVFLLEPEQVRLHNRVRGRSKRRPALSWDELTALAVEAGVGQLFRHALAVLEGRLGRHTTRSSVSFTGAFDGSRLSTFNLIPGQSDAERGLHFQLYRDRFSRLTGLPAEQVEALLPADHAPWSYGAASGPDNRDYEGYEGFITTTGQLDRLAEALGG